MNVRSGSSHLKEFGEFEYTCTGRNHFFTCLSPEIIEKSLVDYLRSKDIETRVNDDEYKVEFTWG